MKTYTKRKIIPRFIFGFSFFLAAFLIGILLLVNVIFFGRFTSWLWAFDILSFIVIPFAFRAVNQAGNYLLGESGEEIVGEKLASLPPHIKVLSNLVINKKYGNIDYLVVDTKGIAIIEVKTSGSRIFFEGGRLHRKGKDLEKDFIQQVKGQAFDVEEEIKKKFKTYVKIQPIIVFANPWSRLRLGMNPLSGTDVIAVKTDWINKVILGRNGFYQDQKRVEEISNYLRKFCEK